MSTVSTYDLHDSEPDDELARLVEVVRSYCIGWGLSGASPAALSRALRMRISARGGVVNEDAIHAALRQLREDEFLHRGFASALSIQTEHELSHRTRIRHLASADAAAADIDIERVRYANWDPEEASITAIWTHAASQLPHESAEALWAAREQATNPNIEALLRARLAIAYAPLVRTVVTHMAKGLPSHVNRWDLVGYGMPGLITAIERCDPTQTANFEAYAYKYIKGAILDEFRGLDWVPRDVRVRARALHEAIDELEQLHWRRPTAQEICAHLGLDEHRFEAQLEVIARMDVSAIDELGVSHFEDDEPILVVETIPAPEPPEVTEGRISLRALRSLPERQRQIVFWHQFAGFTLKEIADKLGVTQSRVSQIHKKAMIRLQERMVRTSSADALPPPTASRPASKQRKSRKAEPLPFTPSVVESHPDQEVQIPAWAQDITLDDDTTAEAA